jgi:hypothetical protein
MRVRVQVLLEPDERERFRREASRRGLTLSAWMRTMVRERLAAEEHGRPLRDRAELRAFFRACDERETGEEPDWGVHRRVLEASGGSVASGT